MPVTEDFDDLPTTEELSKAIDSLPTKKASGLDGIPPEVIKCAKGVLSSHLHKILSECWEKEKNPGT